LEPERGEPNKPSKPKKKANWISIIQQKLIAETEWENLWLKELLLYYHCWCKKKDEDSWFGCVVRQREM
jgi:hypothetical protein